MKVHLHTTDEETVETVVEPQADLLAVTACVVAGFGVGLLIGTTARAASRDPDVLMLAIVAKNTLTGFLYPEDEEVDTVSTAESEEPVDDKELNNELG